MTVRRRAVGALVALLAVLALAACTPGDGGPSGPGPASTDEGTVAGELVVLAAASLTDVFTQVARDLEAANPDLTVTLSLGGSSSLAAQVVSGAPADVFAAASPATMAQVVRAGAASGEPAVFARNRLQIAVPAGNPGDVHELADLADEDLTIALCAEQVPCGAAALRLFEAAGVTPAPDTLEQDVRAALTKVRLGEVDAALVYRTDVLVAGDDVEGVDVPEAGAAVNDYLIATLDEARNPAAAAAFVAYVLGGPGQGVLRDAGFDTV